MLLCVRVVIVNREDDGSMTLTGRSHTGISVLLLTSGKCRV